jgi:EAL domain-containing protein (putative c-di-GMP-specific phosphodiesterase class I)
VLGNDEYQGFLHSRPLPAREIEEVLLANVEVDANIA